MDFVLDTSAREKRWAPARLPPQAPPTELRPQAVSTEHKAVCMTRSAAGWVSLIQLLSLCFSKLLVLGRPLSLARNVGLPYSSVLHCLFSLYILFPRRLHSFPLVIIYFLLTCSSRAHLLISRSMEPTNDRFVHQLMNWKIRLQIDEYKDLYPDNFTSLL